MTAKTLPPRSRVKPEDQWDLSSLFADDRAWDAAFVKWERRIAGYAKFQGTLAESPKQLAACLKFDLDVDRTA
ncbi:MAG TPA: oligoendopeptidase F, partial [Pirellulales bacterium]|nr:oligoendopeptidase F [Pirellulales bacterium]